MGSEPTEKDRDPSTDGVNEDSSFEKGRDDFKTRCKRYWKSFNSVYQSILLGGLVVLYLLIGAAIFVALEAPDELQRISRIQATREAIRNNISMTYNITAKEVEAIIERFSAACQSDLLVSDTTRIWEFGTAVFFATTVVTTIGEYIDSI